MQDAASKAASELREVTAVARDAPDDPLSAKIQALKAHAKQLREQRQRAAKELKAATRKATRLRKRARQLSDEDLVGVLMMRKTARHGAEEAGKRLLEGKGAASSCGLVKAADQQGNASASSSDGAAGAANEHAGFS